MTTRFAILLCILLVTVMASCAARAEVAPSCIWSDPGRNPFIGDRQRAVMSYVQMPLADRILLAWRVRFKEPTDLVSIGPNGVTGSARFIYGDIGGMHFGRGSRCDTVDRSMWPLGHIEPARAYRQGNWCAIVPDVCGNVSLSTCDLTPLAAAMEAAPSARSVPEPGSAGLVLAALGALFIVRGRA